jgi:HK97 family phage prohead protease
MKREVRFITNGELRAKKDKPGIEGYAAVFDQRSLNLGGFEEIVRSSAFKKVVEGGEDVRCLFNHDPGLILGRTSAGTLRIATDSRGMHYDCDLPGTTAAKDLLESIERRDITGCSFTFNVRDRRAGQRWSDGKDSAGQPIALRELLDLEVGDVGPVTYPAYPQTAVSARMLFPDGTPEDFPDGVRAFLVGEKRATDDDCGCACGSCQSDDCGNCSLECCDDDNCEDCPMQDGERALKAGDERRHIRLRMAQATL